MIKNKQYIIFCCIIFRTLIHIRTKCENKLLEINAIFVRVLEKLTIVGNVLNTHVILTGYADAKTVHNKMKLNGVNACCTRSVFANNADNNNSIHFDRNFI